MKKGVKLVLAPFPSSGAEPGSNIFTLLGEDVGF
jgi:hypothetical protein